MKMRNAVMTAALSCPLVLLAGDFWHDKDPSQWSSDEVNQMLANSPWAKQVTASFNQEGSGGRGGGMGGGGGMGRGGGGWGGGGGGMGGGGWGGGGGGMGGGGWGGGGGGMGRGGGGRGQSQGGPALKVTVRWESAAPVHEALVKSEAADVSKFTDWSKDYYVVTVSGLPQMGQNRRGDNADQEQQDPDRAKEMQQRMLDRAKQNTALKLKNRSVAPERVESIDSPGGRTLVFLFPRTANILTDDKELSFMSSMGRMEIRSKFALKEMMFKGKLEL